MKQPLVSAAEMVKNGDRAILDDEGSLIVNKATGERVEVKTKGETFVFEVQHENGEQGAIASDSGAGLRVWPTDQLKEVPMLPKKPGLRTCAANGSEIWNHGRKVIKFRGNDFSKEAAERRIFTRRA